MDGVSSIDATEMLSSVHRALGARPPSRFHPSPDENIPRWRQDDHDRQPTRCGPHRVAEDNSRVASSTVVSKADASAVVALSGDKTVASVKTSTTRFNNARP